MYINLADNQLYHIKHAIDNNPSQNNFQMHAHSHFELLYFLSGDITYIVEGNIYKPKPHDILLFNIAETHKVQVNSNELYERIVIQIDKNFLSHYGSNIFLPFTNKKLGEENIIHPNQFADDLWKKCISRLCEKKNCNNLTASSYLLPLLQELSEIDKTEKDFEETCLSSQIVQYVNEHISEELLPETIAKKFFISRTALYNIFKEATGSVIHNYISVKRLIMARDFLKSGEKPTKVYEKCGFKDYTTFFRAYKSRFLVSPKESFRAP